MTTECKHSVGVTCHCNQTDPCIVGLDIETPDDTFKYFGDDHALAPINVIDKLKKGKPVGVETTFLLTGDCSFKQAHCPAGLIKAPGFIRSIAANTKMPVLLHYLPPSNIEHKGIKDAFSLIFGDKTKRMLPFTSYTVNASQCNDKEVQSYGLWNDYLENVFEGGLVNDVMTINVYPEFSMEVNVKIARKSAEIALNDEQRYELHSQAKKLDSTWSGKIPDKEKTQGFTIDGTLTLTEGAEVTAYSASHATTKSNLPSSLKEEFEELKSSLKVLKAVSGCLDMIKDGTYPAKGNKDIKLLTTEIQWPVVTLKGEAKTCLLKEKNNQIGIKGTITVGLNPLIGFKMTLDLVQAAAAYFKVSRIVKEVREQAKILEDKVNKGESGAYVGATFEITLEANLATNIIVTYAPDKDKPDYDAKAVVAVIIKGNANVRAGFNVWVVHGAFKLEGEVVAEARIALKQVITAPGGAQEKKCVKVFFYHEGIKSMVNIDVSGGVELDDGDNKEKNNSENNYGGTTKVGEKKPVYKQEWVWAKALSLEDAETNGYGITVFGDA